MERFKRVILPSLIFNICETIVIVLIGMLFNLPIKSIIIIMLTFIVSRGLLGKALHFKTWYRCLIWSTAIMLSLFLLLKIDLITALLFTIFSAFIMTGRANINDLYLWNTNKSSSKYQDVIDYINDDNNSNNLIEFENRLKSKSKLDYDIYNYRFKDRKTFAEISEILDIDNPRLVEKLDKIAFAMRIYFGI